MPRPGQPGDRFVEIALRRGSMKTLAALSSRWALAAAVFLSLAPIVSAQELWTPADTTWEVDSVVAPPRVTPLPPIVETPVLPREASIHVPSPVANGQVAESTGEFESTPGEVDRYTALERRFRELERLVKESAPPPKPAAEWVDLSADKWTVKLGGHVQMDWVHWANSTLPPLAARDYFEFRRLRLLADGTGYGVYDFRIQIDIEPEGGDQVVTPVTDIKDAYFTLHEVVWLQRWRIGNFFVPFSLEQVTNDTNNIFLERSIPTQGIFAADREVGMAIYGVSESQNFTWTAGVFLDSISESLKERIDDNQGCRVSGRLTWLPYYDEPSNGRYLVHVGVGLLHTQDQDGVVRFRARPQIHEGPFVIDTGPVAADSYTSGNLELATVWGPVSVQSELFVTSVQRAAGDSATLYGAYVYLSYFLTGENRIYERYGQHGAQFARNVPYSNFFAIPGCISPGAWELKCRTSYLGLDQLDAGHYNDFTLGFNWYWSDRVRVMFDWIHPWTSDGSTPFGSSRSDVVGVRFDVNF